MARLVGGFGQNVIADMRRESPEEASNGISTMLHTARVAYGSIPNTDQAARTRFAEHLSNFIDTLSHLVPDSRHMDSRIAGETIFFMDELTSLDVPAQGPEAAQDPEAQGPDEQREANRVAQNRTAMLEAFVGSKISTLGNLSPVEFALKHSYISSFTLH